MNADTENQPMPQLTQEQQEKILAAVLDQLN